MPNIRPTPSDAGVSRDSGSPERHSIFLNVPDRADLVHDAKRNVLYISTDVGFVERYDLNAEAFLRPLELGGRLLGIDLSPDEDVLVIADQALDLDAEQNWIHIVDLQTETARRISFTTARSEIGTYSVAFIDNERVLVTSSFGGSGQVPFRLVQVADGSAEVLREINTDSMLAANAGRDVIGYAESNSSGGPFGRYIVGTGEFETSSIRVFLYEVSVSPDAAQQALPTHTGVQIFDSSLQLVGTIEYTRSAGAAFSPTDDVIYVSWATATLGESPGAIEAYDTRTLARVEVIASDLEVDWKGNHGFGSGRLKTSRDGRLLFATIDDGVAIYFLDPSR